jgi:flagella basal body P-ring formation protein FlgA
MSHFRNHFSKLVVTLAIVVFASNRVSAAEIEVRATGRCDGRVIRLGDLCEIHTADEKVHTELASIELGPAPQQGVNTSIRARDIQDRLAMLGLNLGEHRFVGSSVVNVNHSAVVKQAKPLLTPMQITAVEKAVERIVEAQILSTQRSISNQRTDRATELRKMGELNVDVMPLLSDEQISFLATRLNQLQVVSPVDPSEPKQDIVLRTAGRNPQDITVKIELRQAPQVVVATRNVPRGIILTSYDVELQPASRTAKTSAYTTIEDVIGRESTVSIAPGQVLDPKYVRSALVVRKGEVVDVMVRSGGINITTKASARTDAGVGDVVQVTLLHNKESLVARVSGPHSVEVLGSTDIK